MTTPLEISQAIIDLILGLGLYALAVTLMLFQALRRGKEE